MLFALVPPVIKWGATSFVTNMAGSIAGFFLWDMIAPEEEPEGAADINLDEQTKKLLEDVIVTNKANLILRNVRQDLYEPLNIDSM